VTFLAEKVRGMPKTAWITYSWADNENSDVDFVVQELMGTGIAMKLDRWNIAAGQRLWDQIATFITDPQECDAWILYATQNSLLSQPCREELAYALDRALNQRGNRFPVIGLFPGSVDKDLIPPAIKTRLFVSLSDPDWKERVNAAVEGRLHNSSQIAVQPFEVVTHPFPDGAVIYEMRPRAGTWSPPIAGVPISEQQIVQSSMMFGPRGRPPLGGGVTMMPRSGPSNDNEWFLHSAHGEATPTMSIFMFCQAIPSRIVFGGEGSSYHIVSIAQRPELTRHVDS
jgi:hypothetical protein